jgi:outer membrane protein assembly factor BamB
MPTRALSIPTALAAIVAAAPVAAQHQWSQFRGPDGRGIAPDDRALPSTLEVTGTMRWSCDIPPGHSSPCIWDDRIFVTGATDREVQTICIDRTSGTVLWTQAALTDMFESRHRINSPATPTPTSDGHRVFVYFGSCGLVCYDLDGNEQWMRRMRIPENMYGTAASPVVMGDRLVFLSDNANRSFLEAIDPTTGATIWRKDRSGFTAGWSSPMHWSNNGVDEVVCYGVGWITAYALADGNERWSLPGLTDEPCITPVAGEGLVFVTSYNMRTNPDVIGLPEYESLLQQYDGDEDGELTYAEIRSNQSILSRYDADGEGDHPLPGFFRFLDRDRNGKLTIKEWDRMYAFLDQFTFANGLLAIRPGHDDQETAIVWQHARGVPECPSPLYYDGRVYMVKNGGIVSCLDAKSGALHYQERLGAGGPYYASPVAGDGKIYAASARGVVTVFSAGDELEVLSRNDLQDRIMATPALVDGTVYVRTDTKLMAFGATTSAERSPD